MVERPPAFQREPTDSDFPIQRCSASREDMPLRSRVDSQPAALRRFPGLQLTIFYPPINRPLTSLPYTSLASLCGRFRFVVGASEEAVMTWWLIRHPISSTHFALWSLRNPGRSFKEFYADRVAKYLNSGKRHPPLGSNLKLGAIEKVPGTFAKLVTQGIQPNDTVVDYGCGTLRLCRDGYR